MWLVKILFPNVASNFTWSIELKEKSNYLGSMISLFYMDQQLSNLSELKINRTDRMYVHIFVACDMSILKKR